MSEAFWWFLILWVSRITAVVVWLASTFGLAVFLLYCLGSFKWVNGLDRKRPTSSVGDIEPWR